MSQEPATITYSLEDVLKEINQKLDRLDNKIDVKFETLQQNIIDIKVGQARLEEKVDGLGKRLDFQEFINRGVLVGFILAILAGLAKLYGIVGNP